MDVPQRSSRQPDHKNHFDSSVSRPFPCKAGGKDRMGAVLTLLLPWTANQACRAWRVLAAPELAARCSLIRSQALRRHRARCPIAPRLGELFGATHPPADYATPH